MRALLAIPLIFTLSLPAFAGKNDEQSRFDRVKKIILLKSHLDRLKAGDVQLTQPTEDDAPTDDYHNTGGFLVGFTNDLLKQFSLCQNLTENSAEQNFCIQDAYAEVVGEAAVDHVIDPIEEVHLASYQPTLYFKQGKVAVDPLLFVPVMEKGARLHANEAPLPEFQEYLALKRSLQKMRVANHQTANFSLQFLNQLKHAYRKHVKGVGKVDAISYLMSAYNRIQMNLLTYQMMYALNLMNSKSAVTTFDTDTGPVSIPLLGHFRSTYAYCNLRLQLKILSQDPSSILFRTGPTVEDALISSVIIGKLPVAWAEELMKRREFQTPNQNPKKILKILSDVGKILLLTQPELVPFNMFGSMIYQTIQKKKENENAAAADTDLFNCN